MKQAQACSYGGSNKSKSKIRTTEPLSENFTIPLFQIWSLKFIIMEKIKWQNHTNQII